MAQKLSLQQWIAQAEEKNLTFARFCLQRQATDMETTEAALLARMEALLPVMRDSVQAGLRGQRSIGGLVGGDAVKMEAFRAGNPDKSVVGPVLSEAITMALAVGEANASMGRIVAAPTAGSSGVLPAVLFALGKSHGLSDRQLGEGLLVAGAIGMVVASRATLSGAAGGCQAECGAAAAMAAGAAVDLCGGRPAQVGEAVAMALKNMLGLVCDPVAGLVEVPCVKRNAGAAAQALVAAEMALAGIKSVIPVDEVIDAMGSVGAALPATLRETARGGLAETPTGREWAKKLFAGEGKGKDASR
ncbi:L-serine ammonia-lyase, iron-sulfur-dependent, subunit alpha [Heliobacterium undosum]|uniref:L-serine dehydratase n=1 Tax=Heliomicrobium undosum TaxID=121734 RepID=A0A845L1L8_9FIRM|nr:L-serine ammonia-lyase, iron-sulfur-dependent, subunit alpha [Heliomicrobium undosum]MZP30113.1 L-serine ammonia-lyase, iron-sulfur-dependent, subunit alpha [Heliomicrobium undosum]